MSNSPTLMTWGSFLTRSLSLIVVLPLALNRLQTEDIAVWFLFSTVITLQTLVDLGFTPTFTRIFAYGMSGVGIQNLGKEDKAGLGKPNWETVRSTIWTVNHVYVRLALAWFLGLLTVGSMLVYKQISFLPNRSDGWIAWSIIVCCSFFIVRGNRYVALLEGLNKIALLRRWETITSLCASATMVIAILVWRNLIAIVAAHQLWQLINIGRNRMLIARGDTQEVKNQRISRKVPEIFQTVWPSAWRSGLGVTMSYGLVQFSGVYFAQMHGSKETAEFLLSLRLIQTIVQFSQAPFYSKIPQFAMLYARNRMTDLTAAIRRSMQLSYLSYVLPFVLCLWSGDFILRMIRSQVAFPSARVWSIFGVAFFFERFGAMHIQVYSLTNKIIWHIANGISGIIFMICVVSFGPYLSVNTIPASVLVSNLGFYSWYSSMHSYSVLTDKFLSHERKTSMFPFLFLVLATIIALLK